MKRASLLVVIALALAIVGNPRPAHAAARSTKIVFVNHTANTLIKAREGLDHGEWTTHPPDTIYAGTEVTWESESDGVWTGTEGWVRYYFQRRTPWPVIPDSETFYLHWDNPYSGSNSYDEATPAGREQEFGFKRDGGGGKNATVKWTLTALVNGLPDSDADSIPDDWERSGVSIQPNGSGAPVFVDLPAMGADTNKPDIFVQTDWMQDSAHNQRLQAAAIQPIVQAFARAPYRSPTGSTGINLHVDNGPDSILNFATNTPWGSLSRAQAILWSETLGGTDSSGNYEWTAFQTIKDTNFTPTGRAPIFHYVIVANSFDASGSSGISRNSSTISAGASDFIISLGTFDFHTGTINDQAGTFMHELGHNLGLGHGGGDDENYKPNYFSVMNYSFQTAGLFVNHTVRTFDYSRNALPTLDKTRLDENVGVLGAPPGYRTYHYCIGLGYRVINTANGPIDWNCNGNSTDRVVDADINRASLCISPGLGLDPTLESVPTGDDRRIGKDIVDGANVTCDTHARGNDRQERPVDDQRNVVNLLTGFDDWANLKFNGGAIGQAGAVALPMLTPADETYTFQLARQIEAAVAPATTLSYSGGAPGQNGWLITPVVVSLSASDPLGNAIAFTEYSFDNQQWTRYSAPFRLPEGITTVFYRSQNSVGVREETKQQTFKIDTITPQSTLTIGLPQYTSGSPPVIPSITPLTLTATDSGSGVQSVSYRYFLQGSAPPAYTNVPSTTGQFTLTGRDGLYEVDSYTTDVAGNSELAHVQLIRLSNTRAVNGLRALYTFEEGSGTTVHDVSGSGTPLDLFSADASAIEWVQGGLVISSATVLASADPATKITAAISTTNELTLEAWVRSARTFLSNTGSLLTLAPSASSRDVTLLQASRGARGPRHYEADLRTSATTAAGKALRSPDEPRTTDLSHIVYTRDALGTARLYVNGVEQADRTIAGNLSSWDQGVRLALANEMTSDRPWLGEYQLVAIYDRALSPAEVRRNLLAGSSGDAARLTTGIQALYTFGEGSGTTIHDVAGVGAPLDLEASDPAAIGWVPGGLVISATTTLASTESATKITSAISTTNELTLEAWVAPATTKQRTLARILTLSNDDNRRNVELLQERAENQTPSHYMARLRTSTTGRGGEPLQTPDDTALPTLQHVVYTRDADGEARLYIDGVLQAQTTIPGDLSTWDATYRLALANTLTGDRPWLGTYELVAIYSRAFSPLEISQNFHAGPEGDQLPPSAPKLQALYTFEEGSGATIHDTAGSEAPLELQIGNPSAVQWVPGGMVVSAPPAITSIDPAANLIAAANATGEATIEAWVAPVTATQGAGDSARIATLSTDRVHRNLMLAQERGSSAHPGRYGAWLRTTDTDMSGDVVRSRQGSLTTALTHVVYTRDALGVVRLYVNGVEQTERVIGGGFSTWDTGARLSVANEITGDRPWLGMYQLVAIYNRALSPAEVVRHFGAGANASSGLH